jgi:hypothetical protein
LVTVIPIRNPRPAVELADEDFYPRMVSFDRSDGSLRSFCYRDLVQLNFNPPGTVEVFFATGKAVVGLRVEPVWQALHSHRAAVVREGSQAESDLRMDREPHIDGITVKLSDE